MSTPKHNMSSRQVFDAISYSALDWPGKTTRLEPDSLEDYLQRPASGAVSIAELYHENSKLHPSKAATLLAARTGADQLRQETLQRSLAAHQVSSKPAMVSVPDTLRTVLSAAKRCVGADLYYAVELRVVIDAWLLIWEPSDEAFTALKQLSIDDLAMLFAALQVIGPRASPQTGPLLFVLGWFARNDLLFGARGYRRTLLEAGRVLQSVVSEAGALDIATEVLTEFTDVDVDRAVEADGVEQGTVSVIAFAGE